MEDSMLKHCLCRGVVLLTALGAFWLAGCRGRQEPKTPAADPKAVRTTAIPKTSEPDKSVPVKPKLLEPQTPPPTNANAETAATPLPSWDLPDSVDAARAKDTIPPAMAKVEPIEQPSPITEGFSVNPLRDEPLNAASNDIAPAPIAEKTIPQVRKIAARALPMVASEPAPAAASPDASPILPPPVATSADSSAPPETPPAALAMPSAATGAEPPLPAEPTNNALSPSADVKSSGDYAVVKVFYGTDRAAVDGGLSKNALFRSYLMLTVAAGAFTAILAFAGFRLLRLRIVKALAALSLLATVVLGAVSVFAAFGGKLPSQTAVAENTPVAYGDLRGTLEMGVCEVSIPKRHETGELECPSILRLDVCEDPAKHVVLLKVQREAASEFFAELSADVARANGNSAFVFVHGYNVTFEDAARRTAQIAYDLKIAGVPILYSWPSQGRLLDYAIDETNVVWTTPHLRQFLTDVARQSGAKQIHLIAHSMGNRALTGALRDISMQPFDAPRPQFDQVLLTAPDIDADVFKNELVPAIAKTAKRVTLYASSRDEALLLSKKLHGYPRAGEAGEGIVIAPGMDTVDVTSVDTSLLGHSYYGDSGTVLADIVEVLRNAAPPDQRKWLRPEYLGVQKYWVFQR
jgi:esterase/lipase superfamily enzyme